MLKSIGKKILSALMTASMTAGLFLIIFLGIKYSSSLKNEVLLKAYTAEAQPAGQFYKLPSPDALNSQNLFSNISLPDLEKYNLNESDIQNMSQALKLNATSTKNQIEGIKMLQSQITSLIFKDNADLVELFNFAPISNKEIKIDIDNSKNAGEKYLAQVTFYFKNDLPENAVPAQAILFIKTIQKNPEMFPDLNLKDVKLDDPALDSFLNLNLYINSYKKLLSDIKSLAVPKSWIDLHKQEILTLQMTIASLRAINEYPDNKLAAAFAFQAINEASNRLTSMLNDFNKSLKTQWSPSN